MEAMFTVPYAEFCVAQQLSRLLPPKRGFRLFVPMSRQEPSMCLRIVGQVANALDAAPRVSLATL